MTPTRARSIGKLMKSVGRRYMQHVNYTCRRTGTLWEGGATGRRWLTRKGIC
jgi:putative transposase